MKLTICLLTRSPVLIFSYLISTWSFTPLFICIVILLANHTQSVINWQNNQMERFCSCGLQVPQQKFCEHDFVLAGKRVNRNIDSFNQRSSHKISNLLPYRGQIYRIRITFNFKGVFIRYSKQKIFVNIYVFKGFNCGISESFELKRHKNYLMSGYKYKNMLIITSCNWLQPFNTLTSMQAMGLFSNFYQKYCDMTDKCQITFHYKSSNSIKSGCRIKTTFKECYEKYAICQLKSENQCGLLSNLTMISNRSIVTKMPKVLRKIYEREKSIESLPLNRFDFCIRIKINNNNHWRST